MKKILRRVQNLKLNHVRIFKYKNIFAKGYVPSSSEKNFVIEKVKNIIPWTNVFSHFEGEETVGTFYKKNYKKENKKNLG